MTFEKITLHGKQVRLEPLTELHADGLRLAAADGELWNMHVTRVPRPQEVDAYIARAQEEFNNGAGVAFATIDIASATVVGSSRFMHANLEHKRAEIGTTFIAKSWQRSHINTEAKLLMLTHAFEAMQMNRVEFLTDYLNTASRNAILRLGAKEEGIMRNHAIMPGGRIRDTVLFSIIANEWAGIKQHLQLKIDSRR